MRLLSFVPCGCRAGPIDDAPPPLLQLPEETTRRRRRRRALRRAAGRDQWRPSLGDICEEEYSTEAPPAKARCRARVAWDVARVLPRAHSDHEYRHLENASSMRPLAPTAFLF